MCAVIRLEGSTDIWRDASQCHNPTLWSDTLRRDGKLNAAGGTVRDLIMGSAENH